MMTAINLTLALLLLISLLALTRLLWRSLLFPLLAPTPADPSQILPAPSHLTETFILLILSFFFLYLFATDIPHGGHLLILQKFPHSLAHAAVTATLIALGLLLLSVFISFKGHPALAYPLAILTLFLYVGLNGELSASDTDLSIPYTISVYGEDVPNAQLFVNGVPLGPLPYKSTIADFLAKVPPWDKPPADFTTDVYTTIEYGLDSQRAETHPHWFTFTVPRSDNNKRIYYARVQYAGEWASACRGFYGGESEDVDFNDNDLGPNAWESGNSSFGSFSLVQNNLVIALPQRRLRLNQLLNIARANNYIVGPAWFTAAETFRSSAWRSINRRTDHEPDLQKILDAWARWKYPIDSTTTPDAAWSLFLQISADADTAGAYDTLSPSGRAITFLAPRLPPNRLLPRAAALLSSRQGFSYFSQWRFDQLQFNTIANIPIPSLAPPSAFVTAHALYAHHLAQLRAGIYPTLVQAHFVPALLQSDLTSEIPLRIVALLGGPPAVQFFLRHDCLTPVETLPQQDRLHLPFVSAVNKWFYFLCQMHDPAAIEFRHAHPAPVLALAANLSPTFNGELGPDIDFIFEDPSLAAAFWPTFTAKICSSSRYDYYKLVSQFQYLTRMNADPPMYVEAFRATLPTFREQDFNHSFFELNKIPDPARRAAVFNAFRSELQTLPIPDRFTDQYRPAEKIRANFLTDLDDAQADRPYSGPGSFSEQIRALKTPAQLAHVLLWLESYDAPKGLRNQLLLDPDPRLRSLAAQALANLPTPARQSQLTTLSTQDPDPTVRTTAQSALQSIQSLRLPHPPKDQ